MRRFKLIAAAVSLLTACTKERPYQEVGKPDLGIKQEKKSVIDTQADYLYVPSTVESSRRSRSSRPHWMGEAKRVRFVFTEKALKVIEPEADGRFNANPVNNRAVLSLPIEHLDYRCQVDAFGDCTHREEENHDIAWNQKTYFAFKPDELALQQINFLPVEMEKAVFGCYEEVGSEFVKAQISETSINLILEKTFRQNARCADFGQLEDLSDLTFSVRYQHSFKRLDRLTTPDYQPIRYTRADESNFGFFSTQKMLLDVDNNDTEDSLKYYFDRWSPRRTVIYYLSESFAKPEYAKIKEGTYAAVQAINNALEKAETHLRLELREPVPGMSSGDINYNMIVLEEDPQAAGVIGYGPHASNPLTGEIVHAKTVMYLGTMKKYLKQNYDEFVELEAQTKATDVAKVASSLALTPQSRGPASSSLVPTFEKPDVGHAKAKRSNPKPGDILAGGFDEQKMREVTLNPLNHQLFAHNLKEKIEFFSKHCVYPAELFNFQDAISTEVKDLIKEVGAKPWLQLNEQEKVLVINALLPHVWVPTLIHELGHNLGLRHNFAGSEDKDNFYSDNELAAMGVQHPFRYSSVMDYAYRTTNELRLMGKYDIAALRYGYAEKVELKDGQIVSLAELHSHPNAELRPYSYCTDEHVSANPNCNRFDEGTNLLEIAQHYVKAYEERYNKANFRNGRRQFSLLNDSAQVGALDGMMYELRLMFERYESVKNTFGVEDGDKAWEDIPFLKQLKEATLLAGQFYLNVLRTPDLLCAVAERSGPSRIIGLLPIRQLSKRAISCFDSEEIRLNARFMIVAEGGKSFASRKAPNSENPYADQIDVRGIWMDKLLAAHYLFARELGSSLFDQYTENFLHVPELRSPILETVTQIALDELQGPVLFHDKDGATQTLNIRYRLFDTNEAENSHKIVAAMDDGVRTLFALPNQTVLFQQKFITDLLRKVQSSTHRRLANGVLNQFAVYRELPRDGRESEYSAYMVDGRRYFVHSASAISGLLAKNLNAVQILSGYSEEQLNRILKDLKEHKDKEGEDSEKPARALGQDVIEKFLGEQFQAPAYYGLMLESLAEAK